METYGYQENPGASVFSIDYYRNKVLEFQRALVSLDMTGAALYEVQFAVSCDQTASAEWYALMNEFESKREQFKLAAEGVNLASDGVNALGVDFPDVYLPGGLMAVPLIPIAAVAASLAVAAGLVAWASGFWDAVGAALQRWQYLEAIKTLPEDQQAEIIRSFQNAEVKVSEAKANASAGGLANIATIVKWVGIGVVGYLAWKTFNEMNASKRIA